MKEKILIIDDDKKLNNLLKDFFSSYGYTVSSVTHPDEGLQMLYTFNPDIIVLDIMLPDMDGFEVCRKIRKDLKFITPDIQVTLRNSGVDLKFSPATPEFLILLSRQGVFNKFYWSIYNKSIPLYSLRFEGVPLISIYRWKDVKLF